jgi:hypothetical protein
MVMAEGARLTGHDLLPMPPVEECPIIADRIAITAPRARAKFVDERQYFAQLTFE